MKGYRYRLAEKKEVVHLSILYQQIYLDTYGLEGITDEFIHFIWEQFSTNKIASDLDNPACTIWVATFKGNLIGLLKLMHNVPSPIGHFTAPEINKLYLLRHFFGKGVAAALLQIAEEELRIRNESSTWLWVLASNQRAVNFYKKNNYQEIGTADFQMEVNRYKNIVMRKDL